MAAIDHPNVIPVYAAGEDRGCLYLVMPYVRGTDLEALLRARGRLAPREAAEIVAQVGAGLDAAHAGGLVHRDVKPANVLIAGEGAEGHAYLTDFGISRDLTSHTELTEAGEWLGSVNFMAPEQLEGQPTDPRTDVYSLGCVLFAALTGRPPFERGSKPATILAHLHDPVPRPSATAGVPEEFDAVVARALAKRPEERYETAGELADANTRAAEHAGPPPREPAPMSSTAHGPADTTAVQATTGTVALPQDGATARLAQPARPRARPTRALLATGGVVAAAGAAVAGFALAGGGSASGPLSAGDVRSVANRFAASYSHEDAHALAQILARNATRVAPDTKQSGRRAVLAEYRRQFADNAVTGYQLTDLRARGGSIGRATAGYRVIRSGAPPITGRIVIGVVREDGKPKIGLITTQPPG